MIRRVVIVSLVSLVVVTSAAAMPGVAGAASVPGFSSPMELDVGVDPLRMVAADLNGDGIADLATADWTSGTVSVLLAKGTGSFRRRTAYRTVRHPAGIAVADVDSDGDPDLLTASVDHAGSISVLSNRGAGRFHRLGRYASASRAYSVAADDINHDGIVDLVTAHDSRRHLTVLVGEGGGRYRRSHRYTGAPATDVALGDLNGDGELDAALATNLNGGFVAVRLGRGDGSFGPAHAYKSGAGSFDVTLVEVNDDDKLDIAVANYGGGTISVFVGSGDGTYPSRRKYAMGEESDAVLVSDFDRDGNLDIAAPSASGPIVRRGGGDGTFLGAQHLFSAATSWLLPFGDPGTQGGTVADFNGDGWPDLAFNSTVVGEQTTSTYVLLNWTGQPAPPCIVPYITNAHPRYVTNVIPLSGCRLGQVQHRHSRNVHKGRVISQRPRHDEVLPSQSPIDVVVSRGKRR